MKKIKKISICFLALLLGIPALSLAKNCDDFNLHLTSEAYVYMNWVIDHGNRWERSGAWFTGGNPEGVTLLASNDGAWHKVTAEVKVTDAEGKDYASLTIQKAYCGCSGLWEEPLNNGCHRDAGELFVGDYKVNVSDKSKVEVQLGPANCKDVGDIWISGKTQPVNNALCEPLATPTVNVIIH